MSKLTLDSRTLGVVATCLLLILQDVQCQSSCRTPSNSQGACITITTCEPLLKLLQNRNRTPAETRLLRESQCGVDNNRKPLVCCPQGPPTIPCTTPDNDQGTCIALRDCQYLLNVFNGPKPLAPQTVQYLRRSTCQGPDRYSVCCGNPSNANIPITSPTTPAPPPPPSEDEDVDPSSADALLPPPTECGMDSSSDRIFGGEIAGIDEYPWMALVEYRTRRNTISLGCGGSLISKRYVITAGHCVKGRVLTDLGTPINVRLGEFNKTSEIDCVKVAVGDDDCNEKPVTIAIETIIPHTNYDPSTGNQKNDIALLRLSEDVEYTDFIRPICLPTSDITMTATSTRMTVAGWGQTEQGRNSDVKLFLRLNLTTIPQCQAAYDRNRLRTELWDRQICAGGEKGKDSCRGDSGGPLMADVKNQWFLHGVVSFGPTPCALEDVPGVYSKVFSYLSWIRRNLKP